MKIYKKIFIFICILFSFLYGLYVWYNSSYLIKETPIPNDIKEKILELNEINFSELVDGEWDTLIIIPPYSDSKYIKKHFNININRLENSTIKYGDGQSLFIFCKKDKIESYFYIRYPLADIDYTSLNNVYKIPRNEAIFTYVKGETIPKLIKIEKSSN
ncbi:hypothetical protein [uncultured Tyzzerella sp.]|uniref:hypothetical protein n=1 Tax=uncultured Tyzzerella sp. TaxID=2321398 RepID=UPI002942A0C6|nr:hypothetical protein [uncultured Tyzzerella sp.]